MDCYAKFLEQKVTTAPPSGFDPVLPMPAATKPFQVDIITWACRRGRAAIFAGTGLGKTLMELTWAANVAAYTGGQVLIFTPLAVAEQTVQEAVKFGIDGVSYAADESAMTTPITITNYDRRDKFDLSQFAGIVLDESGIIKDHDSRTRIELTEACRETPYLLCGSATPAPNDWTELGQHAEFLDVMSAKEMLAMFFVHDGAVRANAEDDWRLKGHAQDDFWRWVSSWSVMIRHPRDLGYEDAGYDLPPLHMHQITVRSETQALDGMLFAMEANTLQERISARKTTVAERVKAAADIVQESWKCGSQNTPKGGSRDTATAQQNGNVERASAAAPSKTESTCAPTTKIAKTDGTSERQTSANGTTQPDGNDTPAIQPRETVFANGTKSTYQAVASAGQGSSASLASPQKSTMRCSQAKGEDALFAGLPTLTSAVTDCTSTTATPQDQCAASFVPIATLQSASSQMTQTASGQQRNTLKKRWVVWCNLNSEQDALAKAFGADCVSVYGSLPQEEKVSRLFSWLRGDVSILVTKPSIAGRGVNMQRDCDAMIFVGLNDSFEQLFQAVRRCWRFGQTRDVHCYLIASDLEGAVVANLQAKERKYDQMAAAMADHMKDLCIAHLRGGRQQISTYEANQTMRLPTWL